MLDSEPSGQSPYDEDPGEVREASNLSAMSLPRLLAANLMTAQRHRIIDLSARNALRDRHSERKYSAFGVVSDVDGGGAQSPSVIDRADAPRSVAG